MFSSLQFPRNCVCVFLTWSLLVIAASGCVVRGGHAPPATHDFRLEALPLDHLVVLVDGLAADVVGALVQIGDLHLVHVVAQHEGDHLFVVVVVRPVVRCVVVVAVVAPLRHVLVIDVDLEGDGEKK